MSTTQSRAGELPPLGRARGSGSRTGHRSGRGRHKYTEDSPETVAERRTQALLAQYDRPWRPRTSGISEVTAAANRQAETVLYAVTAGVGSRRATTAPGSSRSALQEPDVRQMEASFDALMREMQQKLQEGKMMTENILVKPVPEVPAAVLRKESVLQKSKSQKKIYPKRHVHDEWEAPEERMTLRKRVDKDLDGMRSNPSLRLALNEKVAEYRKNALEKRIGEDGGVNHRQMNKLAVKVMSALPAPTGDVLEIDYQLRGRSRAISGNPSRSRPGTAALQASETTTPRSPPRRQLQSAPSSQEQWQRQRQLRQPASPPVSPDKLAAWQGRLREQPTGGAPYPRGVMLSDIDAKAEARKAHRNAVLDRQMELRHQLQEHRQYTATKHERRVAETARQREEDAQREEIEGKQTVFLTVSNLAMIFTDLREKILAARKEKAALAAELGAATLIARWYARAKLRQRPIMAVELLMKLQHMVKPWVGRARTAVRKRHALKVLDFIGIYTGSNQCVVALKMFREKMLFIQRHWRAAIRARKAKLNILYLQWVRYETNMLRERKRQDAEYELRLKREIMMVPAAKRKSVQMKGLPTRAESSSAKKHDQLDDTEDSLGLQLRDEDIRAALANARLHRGSSLIEEDKTADEEQEVVVGYKPKRKVRSDCPGPDGLYLDYRVLKKLGIKALKHGLDADEAAKKKQEEEEEEYATRRVPRELKMVICQMIYKRAKLMYHRELVSYHEAMIGYRQRAPFEETRLTLLKQAGFAAESQLKKPMRPHVRIMLDKSTLAFMHTKGVRMMQVQEAEERQRKADLEEYEADQINR